MDAADASQVWDVSEIASVDRERGALLARPSPAST
jgi:hypothetical protein